LAVSFNRLVVAMIMLMVYCKIHRGLWLPSDATASMWRILMISGFFGFFLADLCVFKAFLILGPRMAMLLQAFTPPIAALMATWYLGDPLGGKDWLGMAVTLSGVVWVVLEQPESSKEIHHRKDFSWGVVLALGSALFAAIGQVFAKEAIRADESLGGYDPFAITLIRVIGGIVCYLPLIVLIRRWRQIGKSILHGRAMSIVVFGAFVGPVLGVASNMKALSLCSPGVVTTLIATTPILILPFVIVLYKEKVSFRAAIGALISVIGVSILMWGK
jgi:drug/metabolite transporter (DMT)-like permease